VPTPVEVITGLSQEVVAMTEAGVLTQNQGNGLLIKLEAAQAALERDNTTAAANQIQAVIHQLAALVNGKKLDSATADALIADLESALSLL
jgi:hypothetical protein